MVIPISVWWTHCLYIRILWLILLFPVTHYFIIISCMQYYSLLLSYSLQHYFLFHCCIILLLHCSVFTYVYRMAGNFGSELILPDWWLWEQSTNISSTKKFSVMSSLLQTLSFLCTRPAARRASLIVGMEFTIESCVGEHHFSKEFCTLEVGEELPCLSTRGRRSKQWIRNRCKDRCDKNSPD